MGEEIVKKKCRACGKNIRIEEYYVSTNKFDMDGRVSICKSCLKANVDYNNIQTVKDTLLNINRPFLYSIWESAKKEGERKNSNHFGLYMKTICMKDFKDLTWVDSDMGDNIDNIIDDEETKEKVLKTEPRQETDEDRMTSENENQNKIDVIRMVGYDPFEYESTADRRHLYNKLVDFLDEATLEDGFKLSAVIEIVKSYNQLDKINNTISSIYTDIESISQNSGYINSLIGSKNKLYQSVLALAKDNGISVNHNNNKSKGGNTLNGIVKKLDEIGLEEAKVNLFDLETCAAMKQIADISHKSILDQLLLDENDYAEMLSEQKKMIEKLESEASKYEEDNRLLKIKINELEHKLQIQ